MRKATTKWAKRKAEFERRRNVDGLEAAVAWARRFRTDRLHKLFPV